jgi:hypothetical protein
MSSVVPPPPFAVLAKGLARRLRDGVSAQDRLTRSPRIVFVMRSRYNSSTLTVMTTVDRTKEVAGVARKERKMLRAELNHLRVCQITFLTSAVTATGAILGFGTSLSSPAMRAMIGIFPPLILLPAWWVFFDKATSITRIVGYSRVLEQILLQHRVANSFPGWENALRKFRDAQLETRLAWPPRGKPHDSFVRRLWRLIRFRTGHRYWLIANIVFAVLTSFSLALPAIITDASGASALKPLPLFVSIGAVAVFTLTCHFFIIWSLIYGRHSYDANEAFWQTILEVVPEVGTLDVGHKDDSANGNPPNHPERAGNPRKALHP